MFLPTVAFTGNPLAVFPEAEGILDREMQQVANEMNLSETVFVLPSDKALEAAQDIYASSGAASSAGDPVVGTWNMLARLGITPQIDDGVVEIQQELNLGVLPVEIEFKSGEPFKVTIDARQMGISRGGHRRDRDCQTGGRVGLGLAVRSRY